MPDHNLKQGVQHDRGPGDQVSGDKPMTGAMASCLKTLSEEAHQPELFAEDLIKAKASQRIDAANRRWPSRITARRGCCARGSKL
jgi:hypothetical protein